MRAYDPVYDTINGPPILEKAEWFEDWKVKGWLSSTSNEIIISDKNQKPDTIRTTIHGKPSNNPPKK